MEFFEAKLIFLHALLFFLSLPLSKPKQMRLSFYFLFLLTPLLGCFVQRDSVGDTDKAELNLSKQRLGTLPDELLQNRNLKVLRLYKNDLSELPEEIGDMQALEELYIGKNNLKSLPEGLCRLKNLKILSIQYNQLEKLPDSIGKLVNLEQLILNQNRIKRLPESIGDLKKLEVLKLEWNKIDTLTERLFDCENLKFITLRQNDLRDLNPAVSKLKKLIEINLAYAGFAVRVPESICELRRLEYLYVDRWAVLPNCVYVLKANRLKLVVN